MNRSARVGVALLLALAGCIQVEETIELRPDGSGLLDLRYGMSLETIRHLEEFLAVPEGPVASPLDFDETSIRDSFREFEPHGVTLTSLETETRNGWKYMHLRIAFRDLGGLTRTPFLSEHQVSLKRDTGNRYTFRLAAPPRAPDESPAAGPAPVDSALKEPLRGFRVTIRLKLPGRVLATSGTRLDERTVVWDFDLEKDGEAVARAEAMDLWATFSGKGLKLPEFVSLGGPAE